MKKSKEMKILSRLRRAEVLVSRTKRVQSSDPIFCSVFYCNYRRQNRCDYKSCALFSLSALAAQVECLFLIYFPKKGFISHRMLTALFELIQK